MRQRFVPTFKSVRVALPARLKDPDVAPSSKVTPPVGEMVTRPVPLSLQTVMAVPSGNATPDSSGIVHV